MASAAQASMPVALRSTDADATERATNVRDRDTIELARAGKKQVLKRRFDLLSMISFSCILTITWEGTLDGFTLGLQNGGPAGLVYGYIIAWAGTLSVSIALGELASMYPTAGGQYHWVSVLAPQPVNRLLSYLTGWATVVSWVAGATLDCYAVASLIQGAITLNLPSNTGSGWQGTLLIWAVLLLSVIVTTVFGQMLPTLEILLLLLHILGFFGAVIPLAYHAGSLRSTDSAGTDRVSRIFTSFFNLGEWNSNAVSFFIGIQGNAGAFLGLDGAIHMSEEVANSSTNVPRSIIYTIIFNGMLGFAMLLTVLLSADNLTALAQSESTFPFINLLASGLGSIGGATTIVAVVIFMDFANIIAALSASGRMMWSFARDRGLPGWGWLRRVNKRTSIPFNTIFVTAVITALVGLINIGSETIFFDVVSLSLQGFYLSYLLAISMLLYRRLRGDIHDVGSAVDFISNFEDDLSSLESTHFWGPWRLRGWLGTLNNCFAVAYLLLVGFFSFWPNSAATNAANMNYSCLVLGSVLLGSLAWYFIQARKYYVGPVIEVQIVGGPHPTFDNREP